VRRRTGPTVAFGLPPRFGVGDEGAAAAAAGGCLFSWVVEVERGMRRFQRCAFKCAKMHTKRLTPHEARCATTTILHCAARQLLRRTLIPSSSTRGFFGPEEGKKSLMPRWERLGLGPDRFMVTLPAQQERIEMLEHQARRELCPRSMRVGLVSGLALCDLV